MKERLVKVVEAVYEAHRLREIVDAHAEWLYVRDHRRLASLRRSEVELSVAHGRLIFNCVSDAGAELWRVVAWRWTGERLLLEARKGAGRESALLELIPRVSFSRLLEDVSAVRRARASTLAQLARAQAPRSIIERVSLSAGAGFNRPGNFARILLKHMSARICVTGMVSRAAPQVVDALLSSTLIWLARLRETSRSPKLWIAVEKPCLEPLRQRTALLREDIRCITTLFEIDEEWRALTLVPQRELEELLDERPKRISAYKTEVSEVAARIIARAPQAIDLVRSRHGETLRFHGLPFARVRRTFNEERVRFGLDSSRRLLLDESTEEEWNNLLRELAEHRRHDAPARHHALYRQTPEAWLESILRRDIKRLDPGLRLAPLHAQFRLAQTKSTASRPVDLLALRDDGRLAVIELKVTEDREHVLQGADYWRRVEASRRQGAIRRARLFDDARISDEPPLLYLVAPALRFHRAFLTLARSLRSEIELYRFDLNEDWRAQVRVTRRERVNPL